jgi:phenylpropionate dioxygenase-like ring-hydroxylating dioxygenase large terminal subunit
MVARNELDEAGEQLLYEGLRRYWHPVMFADELTGLPQAVTLLGERVVVVRLGGGVSAFRDLCVHRGSALSVGKVVDGDQLVCGYHGWRYNKDGICISIPARPGASIPSKARVQRYDAAEHVGLIWVCLDGPPELPLPQYPEFADTAYHTIKIPTYDWRCGAARRVENFVDVAHLPFIHEGILGDPRKPEVPNYQVTRTDAALCFAAGLEQQPGNPFKLDGADSATLIPREPINYMIQMPFTVHLGQPLPDGKHYVLFMVASPVSPRMTRSFSFGSRNYDRDLGRDDEFVEYQRVILEQDRVVVETQRPEELPVDLAAELHVGSVDRASVEYRRWLAEIARSAGQALQV